MDKFRRECPVLNCPSISNEDNVIFFRFPMDCQGKLVKLWNLFTRIKGFKPITSEALCQKHFLPEQIKINKKGRPYLQKNTVPTIYYRNEEKIVVQYDPNIMQYVGYEAEMMLQEIERDAFDEEKELLKKRYEKVKLIKNLCRFCFSNEKDVKCVAMSKLQTYSIDIAEMISILGIDQEYSEAFNDIVCANCFDRLIEFSNYRKRCQTAQKDLILSMQDLDRKILEAQQLQRYQRNPSSNWLKVELQDDDQMDYNFYDADTDKEEEEETHDTTDDFIDTTEHYLEEDTDDEKTQEYFEEVDVNEDSQKESQRLNLFEITIKNEPHDSDEHAHVENKPRVSTRKRKQVEEKKEEASPSTSKKKKTINKKEQKMVKKEIPKTPNQVISPSVVKGIDNFKNKPFGSRKKIHECFFCREKFVGKKTYKTHNCPNKRIKCEVEGCDLYFVNQGGYNIHIQRKHALPKVSRHLCPVCRTNYQMSAAQYDEHCKRCLEANEYREQPIKCDKCKKIFGTLQSYTAHIQFHDDESLKKASELLVQGSDGKARKAEIFHMCDLCGRVFRDSYGLRRHQSDVHYLDFTGEMFYCDLCPIAKPTKRLLYNHMKSTHIIRWHSCEICGKVFKNRELWRKHQLVHGDFKKNNLCDYCPHRPGFVTNTALRKHLAKHHGGAEPVRKFVCDIPHCGAAYSRDDQLTRHRVNVHQIYHNNYNESIIQHYVNG
ncbi:hypothetical protein ACKWTF_011813 [Chironomus riparius]